MEKLLQALKDKGIIEAIQMTVDIVEPPKTSSSEELQKVIDHAVEICLYKTFTTNKELEKLFSDFCIDLGMNALVKELAIKRTEGYTFLDFLSKLANKN